MVQLNHKCAAKSGRKKMRRLSGSYSYSSDGGSVS